MCTIRRYIGPFLLWLNYHNSTCTLTGTPVPQIPVLHTASVVPQGVADSQQPVLQGVAGSMATGHHMDPLDRNPVRKPTPAGNPVRVLMQFLSNLSLWI